MYIACMYVHKSGVCSSDVKADQRSYCWQCIQRNATSNNAACNKSDLVRLASAVVIEPFYRRILPHNTLKVPFTYFELTLNKAFSNGSNTTTHNTCTNVCTCTVPVWLELL